MVKHLKADGKLSSKLRKKLLKKAYGFTVPAQFGGLGLNYNQLCNFRRIFSPSNGLVLLAVEIIKDN